MKIFVKVRPNSKEEVVKEIDPAHFEVKVKEPARDGKANSAAASALADYFDVSKSRIKLLNGFKSKRKIFEIFQ